MDKLQVALAIMAVTDTHGGPRDAYGRRRQLTAEELDALADVGWHLPDIRGTVAACRIAVLQPWRWALRNGCRRADLAPAESN